MLERNPDDAARGPEAQARTGGRTRLVRSLTTTGLALLLAGGLVLLFAASFYLTMRLVFVGGEVAVPDLAGLPLDEAQASLTRAQLYLEKAAERHDDRVARDHVASQDPPAGSTIKKNRKVRVIVSLGPLEVTIPDLRGESLRTAQIALQRERLSAGRTAYTHDDSAAPDVVLAQEPPPWRAGEEGGTGLEWDEEGRVDLLVSRGPYEPVYVMPDLSRRRLDEVRAFAARAGLRVGAVRRERAPGTPRGTVVRQTPQAGYPVGRRDIIGVILSE